MSAAQVSGAVAVDRSHIDLQRQIILQWISAHRQAAIQRLAFAQSHQERFDLLSMEFPNFQASHTWLTLQNDTASARLLIAYADTLAPFLHQCGLPGTLLRWCDHAIEACERLHDPSDRLLLMRSEAQHALGQWEAARASIEAALTRSAGVSHKSQGRATFALGRLELNQGHYDRALALLRRAEQLLTNQNDDTDLAAVRAEVAAYYLQRDDLDRALDLYLDIDQLQRRSGRGESSDHVLLMLGIVYRKKRDYGRAAVYLQQLMARAAGEQRHAALATAAHHLAWVWINVGHLHRARQLAGQAIALYRDIGDTRGLSDAYEQLGIICLAERNIDEAESHLQRSLDVRRAIGNEHGTASCLRHLAVLAIRRGHSVQAAQYLWHSLSTYYRLGVLSRHRLRRTIRELLDWGVGKSPWTV